MKSPGKILGVPVYMKEIQQINSSKLGGLVYAPKTSNLDLHDVFDGESLCLIDYICSAEGGDFDWPEHVSFMVKTGAQSTPTGWECVYDTQMKVVVLSKDKNDEFRGKTIR